VIGLQRPLAYCYKGNLTLTLIISDTPPDEGESLIRLSQNPL